MATARARRLAAVAALLVLAATVPSVVGQGELGE